MHHVGFTNDCGRVCWFLVETSFTSSWFNAKKHVLAVEGPVCNSTDWNHDVMDTEQVPRWPKSITAIVIGLALLSFLAYRKQERDPMALMLDRPGSSARYLLPDETGHRDITGIHLDGISQSELNEACNRLPEVRAMVLSNVSFNSYREMS